MLTLRYGFGFSIYVFINFLIKFRFIFFLEDIYKMLKLHRKKFLYLSIFTLFILIPPDPFLQIFVIVTIFILYEIFFFVICYKIINIKF